jgi:ABC-type dipeptide/oligopeptide/nickel transport system ATPase subunit
MSATSVPLLRAENLVKHFPIRQHLFGGTAAVVHAVDGVNFELRQSDTMALVGESGCGKSTVGRLVLRLLDATSGRVWFDGEDLMALPQPALRAKRRELQMIFQDPYSSLNPRMTVEQTLAEPLALHGLARGRHRERAAELMDLVGLAPQYLQRFPHEFSGGQRQRIGIARALAVEPRLIVCDEPVSALDVSIQAPPRPGLCLHRPRPGGGQAHRFPCGRDVPGPHRRIRRQAQPVRRSPSSLYAGPAVGDPGARAGRQARAYPAAGRRAQPDHATVGLPLPNPLPVCARAADGGHSVACHFWEEIGPPAGVTAAGGAVNERLVRLQSAFRGGGTAGAGSEVPAI